MKKTNRLQEIKSVTFILLCWGPPDTPLVSSAEPGDLALFDCGCVVCVVGVFGGPDAGVFGAAWASGGEGGRRTGEHEESREPSPSDRSSGSLPTWKRGNFIKA